MTTWIGGSAARVTVPPAVLVLTALLALVAGCGGGGDRLPPTDDPVIWAGRLCDALQPLAGLKGDVPNFNRNNPAESRQAMSQFFGQATTAADQGREGLDQVGPSPIAGGDDVAHRLRDALGRLRTAYANAKTKIDAVDPNDPVGMGTQLPGILTELDAASNNASLNDIASNQPLADAVRQAPSCAAIGAAGAGG